MANSGKVTVCGDCGHPLDDIAQQASQPCPECGSTTRNISVVVPEGIELADSIETSLTRFIDRSTPEAANASATALLCITSWVEDADELTARHVADGNISPEKVGVPLGPYTPILVRNIVKTIRNERHDGKRDSWDRTKTYVGWGFAAIGALIAYLTFIR